jgi:hypothetical protein
MYNAFLSRTTETITALAKHIQTSDRFRAAVFDGQLKCASGTPCFDLSIGSTETAPDRLEWRIIDHCAAVTRIYAIYEQFAHEMIREHLSLLQSRLFPISLNRSGHRTAPESRRYLIRKKGPDSPTWICRS